MILRVRKIVKLLGGHEEIIEQGDMEIQKQEISKCSLE